MTCIVGIKTSRGVLLGGDTQGSAGWNQRDRADDKVFTLGPHRRIAVGFTSSYRMGQLLRFHLEPPAIDADDDLYRWAVTKFVVAARALLKEHGYVKIESSREESGTFLLAVRDRLFQVHDDFQVSELAGSYDSCGCGDQYAMGALHALEGSNLPPRKKAKVALEAAARWSNGVGSRVTFVETLA